VGWSSDDLRRDQGESDRSPETPANAQLFSDQIRGFSSLPTAAPGPHPSVYKEETDQPLTGEGGGSRWRMRLSVAWISAVLLAYYLVHLPLSQSIFTMLRTPAHQLSLDWLTPLRLGSHIADIILAFWILLLGAALGQRIWHWSHLPAVEGGMRVALGSGLGLGALSLISFVFGVQGWLSPWTVWSGFLLLSLLCARDGWWLLRWLREQAQQAVRSIQLGSWLDRLLWCSILLTALLMLLAALLPPTAWDALMYHLAAPAVDIQQGRVLPDPANFQGYQPELVEMLYLDGFLLRGDGPAALIHLGFGVLSLLVLITLARRITDPARGAALALRAAALFLSIPSLVLVLAWPYIDGALVYYELAALCALLCWWNGGGRERIDWLLLAGGLLGLGVDVKYTAAFALGALGVLVLWRAWRAERLFAALWQAGLLASVALVVGSPWLLRNLLLTGNPIFPYHLGHVFPAGPQWDDVRTQHVVEGPGWGEAQSWRVLTLPLEVTLYGTQGSVEFDATLGPLLLLLLPLGLLVRQKALSWRARKVTRPEDQMPSTQEAPAAWSERQVVGVLLAFAAMQLLCWDVELLSVHFARQSRLFFPLFAALTLPAAAAWLRLKRLVLYLPGLHRLVSLVVVLVLALGVLGQVADVLGNGNAPYLLGLQSRQAYLADHLDPYYAAMGAVNALPSSSHVLALWEARSYYASQAIHADPFLDNFDYYYRHCPGTKMLAVCLHQAGFTHLLFYAQGLALVLEERPGGVSPQELAALWNLLSRFAKPVYQDTAPLIKSGHEVGVAEQLLGQRGWYRLYALPGSG
jgi:hypothetical protein